MLILLLSNNRVWSEQPAYKLASVLRFCQNTCRMVLSMERWQGKVAIVTGTSAGIGVAIAEALVNEGVKVRVF